MCRAEQGLCALGWDIFQGLSLQRRGWVIVCFWIDQFGVLGCGWNPTDYHQLSNQVQPWSLSCFPTHLGRRVRFLTCMYHYMYILYLLKPRNWEVQTTLIFVYAIHSFFLVLFFIYGSDVFNLVVCLLEPATVSVRLWKLKAIVFCCLLIPWSKDWPGINWVALVLPYQNFNFSKF